MNAIVIEHVKVSELPETWRTHIAATENARVTVRIEPEPTVTEAAQDSDDPLYGMWHDRAEMADVQAYVRKLRSSRF
jgi:hypothetical protein